MTNAGPHPTNHRHAHMNKAGFGSSAAAAAAAASNLKIATCSACVNVDWRRRPTERKHPAEEFHAGVREHEYYRRGEEVKSRQRAG